ncbi:MAG TPA: ATP-binding protein [Anaerolineales bacterium]
MKNQIGSLDATPLKRLYLSIIADYDLKKAICELIDNAIDIWVIKNRASNLNIHITLDLTQQSINVGDDAGGVNKSDLSFIVGPGHTGNLDTSETIGIFGVGTKRAVVALAQEIKIRTRYQKGDTYQIEFDDMWIKQNDDWNLPVFQIDNIKVGTTEIELVKLRNQITEDKISQLKQHLGATYGLAPIKWTRLMS